MKTNTKNIISGEILINGHTGDYHILESNTDFNLSKIIDGSLGEQKTICITSKNGDTLFNRCGISSKKSINENLSDYLIDEINITDVLWDNLNNEITFMIL